MTVIYVPRLIESAEQAEALPEGTLARHAAGSGMDHAHKVRPLGRDLWMAVGGNCTNAEMIGWSALVPIEAEEETREHPTRVEERPESAYLQPVQQVRYKTRWEAA